MRGCEGLGNKNEGERATTMIGVAWAPGRMNLVIAH